MPTTVSKICEKCGETFQSPPNLAVRAKYCSAACRNAVYRRSVVTRYTGNCGVCGVDVPSPRRFCGNDCRDASLRTGQTMGEYTCAMCGKVATRPINDARRQKTCSRACAIRLRAADVMTPVIDPLFGSWLAGLADGEGHFAISKTPGRTGMRFVIALRRDDRPMLEMIQRTLGFGKLYDATPTALTTDGIRPVHPKTSFSCNSFKECREIASIFTAYPLRSKKARDFAIWAEALAELADGANGMEILAGYASRLRSCRVFTDSLPDSVM